MGQILEKFLLENTSAYNDILNPENPNAPLSSFGSRIVASYGFGLISELDLKALRIIKSIRNRFAHDLQLSFIDKNISKHCTSLSEFVEGLSFIEDNPGPRNIFITTAAYFYGNFKQILDFLEHFGIKGGFKTVLRLSVGFNDELDSRELNG